MAIQTLGNFSLTVNDAVWEGLKAETSENFVNNNKDDLEIVMGYLVENVFQGSVTTMPTGLQNVKPGQLITADFMNALINKVNELGKKVAALENASK